MIAPDRTGQHARHRSIENEVVSLGRKTLAAHDGPAQWQNQGQQDSHRAPAAASGERCKRRQHKDDCRQSRSGKAIAQTGDQKVSGMQVAADFGHRPGQYQNHHGNKGKARARYPRVDYFIQRQESLSGGHHNGSECGGQ